ncbi:MAG: N-acetylmuramoyl-L-alanine amidase [Acutalibacteraceae bacterium]
MSFKGEWYAVLKRFTLAVAMLLCLVLLSGLFVTGEKSANVSAKATQRYTVIIDAGHGGFDGGAVAPDGTLEKDLNLSVALKLDSVLKIMGYDTVLVRDTDVSTADDKGTERSQKVSDIKARLRLTEKYKDALFVSIHMNKYTSPQPHGAQVFYSQVDGSKELAECIQRSITAGVQTDNKRVVKKTTKDIYLLYHAVIPSVIAECGFISNPDDLLKLKSDEYQLKMAAAIAAGINDYYFEGQ